MYELFILYTISKAKIGRYKWYKINLNFVIKL